MHTTDDYRLIHRCLSKLGRIADDSMTFVKIYAGRSGSTVFDINLGNEHVILKYTDPAAYSDAQSRALRELRFYEALSSLIDIPIPESFGSFADEQMGVGMLFRAYRERLSRAAGRRSFVWTRYG